MEIDVSELEKSEEDEVVIPAKKIRIFPSEIGSWEYCNLKWLYEKSARNRREI